MPLGTKATCVSRGARSSAAVSAGVERKPLTYLLCACVRPGRVAVDGRHPSLACGTSSGKVFVHSPHDKEATTVDGIRMLSINRAVTGLSSGCIDPGNTPNSMLFVGTQTNLLTYDVENNSDLFYKDVPDGVNSVAFGRIPSVEVRGWARGELWAASVHVCGVWGEGGVGWTPNLFAPRKLACGCSRRWVCATSPSPIPPTHTTHAPRTTQAPMVFVGGHCSVQGFDGEGNELYWTVTGDNVSALAFVDTNGDGHAELVVGSDDFEIRVFKDDDVLEVCLCQPA